MISGWCNSTEPPRTHEKLSYDPCFLCSRRFGNAEPLHTRETSPHEKLLYDPCIWVIQTSGAQWVKQVRMVELMTNYPMILVPSIPRFKDAQYC